MPIPSPSCALPDTKENSPSNTNKKKFLVLDRLKYTHKNANKRENIQI